MGRPQRVWTIGQERLGIAKGFADEPSVILTPDPLSAIFRRSMLWVLDRQAPSAWIEHVPFAFWLVDVLRPRSIVELGTHTGVSYSAMCQAVQTLGLSSSCFAVDTWKGDDHAGFYAEDVYREFRAFHDRRYSGFSRLVRSTFDEAVTHFSDGSIDLLHIDGLHTSDAVRHDFESWLPKLSSNAVVLFHDTNVREASFAVHQFWAEVSCDRPHFQFLHGHGLGILAFGTGYSRPLSFLLEAQCVEAAAIRTVFSELGRHLELAAELHHRDARIRSLELQVDTLKAAIRLMSGAPARILAPLLSSAKALLRLTGR